MKQILGRIRARRAPDRRALLLLAALGAVLLFAACAGEGHVLSGGAAETASAEQSIGEADIPLSEPESSSYSPNNRPAAGGEGDGDPPPATSIPGAPSAHTLGSMMGVNTHWGKGWVTGDPAAKTVLLADAGFGWVRDEMEWSRAEAVKGMVTVLPEWDDYVDALVARGVKPLIVLDFGNPHYDDFGPPHSEEGLDAFVHYVRTIVSHFDGRVDSYEIWNEYNLEGSDFNPTSRPPEDYARLLRECYLAIKEINPDITVVGGSMSGMDLEWLGAVLDAGGGDYMDALSLHPYCFPDDPESGFVVQAMLYLSWLRTAELDLDLPIWITEIGWPTHSGPYGVSEAVSGDNLIKTYVQLIAVPGIERVFWYDLEDDGLDPLNPEANFGLLTNWQDVPPNQPKENYLAALALAGQLADARFVGSYREEGVTVYQFRAGERETLVAWAADGGALRPDGAVQGVWDARSQPLPFTQGEAIELDESPVFVAGTGIIR